MFGKFSKLVNKYFPKYFFDKLCVFIKKIQYDFKIVYY